MSPQHSRRTRIRGSDKMRDRDLATRLDKRHDVKVTRHLADQLERASSEKKMRWFDASRLFNLGFRSGCPPGCVNKFVVYLPIAIPKEELAKRLKETFGDLK